MTETRWALGEHPPTASIHLLFKYQVSSPQSTLFLLLNELTAFPATSWTFWEQFSLHFRSSGFLPSGGYKKDDNRATLLSFVRSLVLFQKEKDDGEEPPRKKKKQEKLGFSPFNVSNARAARKEFRKLLN